jgi:cytochrome c oxidase subunit III
MMAAEARRMPGTLLGMLLFISSELMFFAALFAAYFTISTSAAEWPPPGAPELPVLRTALFSAALVSSSFTAHAAVAAVRRNDRPGLVRWLAITIGLGLVFLGGQAFEYSGLWADGFGIASGVFTTLFFTMTGFHGLHVLGGLLALVLMAGAAHRGEFSASRHGPVEAVSYYWHFVDVVWVLLFGTLYLFG